ncbi:MAG: T9SS type A sorting domain-containing protein [Bacteroidia bacterium]
MKKLITFSIAALCFTLMHAQNITWNKQSNMQGKGFSGVFTPLDNITTIAGTGTSGYTGDGGSALFAGLSGPYEVTTDLSGNIYIADAGNYRIRKINASTGIITTIAGTGAESSTGDGGPAIAAGLAYPVSVAVDNSGNIYIGEQGSNRIRKVNTAGIITTVAGNGTYGYSGDGGQATAAQIGYPYGIAVDDSGNLYMGDETNYVIRKINTSGIISTIAGNNTYGYSGDGNAATAAQIGGPSGVAVDSSGNIFMVDHDNSVIRMINTSGIITTVAGDGNDGYQGDGGPATSASLGNPESIALDAYGDIFITDQNNYRIREVDATGNINTVAGNGTNGFSGDGGSATAAQISVSQGITVNSSGNVLITDGQRIREIVYDVSAPTAGSNSPVCSGDTLKLTAGYIPGATYYWMGPDSFAAASQNPVITNASYAIAGTYYVYAIVTGDTSARDTVVVSVDSLPSISVNASSYSICSGSSAMLNASGGVSYAWSPNTGLSATTGNTVTANPGVTGTYSVIATGTDGCRARDSITITVNSGPTVSISGNDTICSGNGTNLIGGGAVTFSWAPANGLTSTTASGVYASPTVTTTYTLTETAPNGCSNSDSVTVTVNPTPAMVVTGSTKICKGNSTTLTASGATSYSWNTGLTTSSLTVSPASDTNYSVNGTNAFGCANTQTVEVIVNTPSPISANVFPSASVCAGGEIVLYGNGGSAYSWSGGVNDGQGFRPLTSATYTVTSISNSCPISDSIHITVNALPDITITSNPGDTVCAGGSVTLTASGASTFVWNNGISNGVAFTPASSDVYGVTGTDSNGCNNSAQVTITVNNLPVITGAVSPQTVCQGNPVTLNGNGGVSYNWSGGVTNSVPFTPAISGSYTVTGTDAAGCTNTDVVEVTVNAQPVIGDSAVPSANVCEGTSVALMGTGGSSYSWSGGVINGISFIPTVSGTYYVTGYGANGCTGKDSITINVNSKIINTPVAANTTCGLNNGSVKILSSGGTPPYTYTWSTTPVQTTDSIGGLSPGTYIVTVSDTFKCATYSTIDIASSTAPILSVSTTSSSCGNATGSASVGVVGGTPPYMYSWSNGNTTNSDNALTLGTYIITVTDANKCSSYTSADISNLNGPSITSSGIVNVRCNGQANGSININVSGGAPPYNFLWSNGATSQNIGSLAAGPYQVTVTDADSCSALGNFTITQPSALSTIKSTVKANCGVSDGSAMVKVSGGMSPYSYLWNNGHTSDSILNVPAGAYYVTVTDKNSCEIDSAQVSVSNINGPVVSIGVLGSASCGSGGVTLTANVTGGTLPYTYQWSNANTNSSISKIPAGSYNVVVTDQLSCVGVADTTISELLPPVAPICMVTVDTATGKNMIIWDKGQTSDIASYNIYKETTQAGVYLKIANVPYNAMSTYIDTLSNPQVRSWRYELSQVDSCGNESPLSPDHKTMHLTVNQGIGGTVNLIWDNYEGMVFYTYYIYRDSVPGSFTLIDSIPNNIFTYTDTHPLNTLNQYYRVEVVNPDPCNPHTNRPMAVNYNSSKSNTGNYVFNPVSVKNITPSGGQVSVFPNPSTGVFTVSMNMAKGSHAVSMTVVNTLGQEISTETFDDVPAAFTKQLDLSSLAKGVYFLKITSDNSTFYNKIVIQ